MTKEENVKLFCGVKNLAASVVSGVSDVSNIESAMKAAFEVQFPMMKVDVVVGRHRGVFVHVFGEVDGPPHVMNFRFDPSKQVQNP